MMSAATGSSDVAETLMALLNLAVCSGIVWASLCRVHLMSAAETAPRFKLVYVMLCVGAFASGFSPPLFREIAGPGQILMSIGVLYMLASGSAAWRNGAPAYTRRHPPQIDPEVSAL